ncbi:MAG TPA: ABC transporter permease [Vicinamibacterales bacterium]|nr:ABC transporter permease [Vicinamibacterales bacterium]
MASLWRDLRYALRLIGRSPGFAVVAVLTIALGIGVNVAMFSVAHAVLLAPLPYPDADRLVRVFEESAETPRFPVAPGNFVDYRSDARAFEAIAAYERSDLQLYDGDRAEHVRAMRVTAGFFALLGSRPMLGRELGAADELPEAEAVVVLGHEFWLRRFNGDPSVLGRALTLSGRPFRVVGVLPAGFRHVGSRYRSYGHGEPVDAWWARSIRPVPRPADRYQHYLNVVARLRPDVTLEQAQAEMKQLSRRLAERHPESNAPWTARLVDAREETTGRSRPMIVALLGSVQLVLLLACANVAGLLIGRGAARSREIGVRAALGATRFRLARQLMAESVVLAAGGGLAGLALAALVIQGILAFGPADVPRLSTVRLDVAILLYAVAATAATAVLCGVAPIWRIPGRNLIWNLKEAGRGTAGAPYLRRSLVAAQISLAFVLVVTAGLLLRSFVNLLQSQAGFRAAGVLTAVVNLPQARYDDGAAVAFYRRLISEVSALPGVGAAGLGSALPWTGYDENTGFAIAGRTFPENEGPEARYHAATPGFFRALSIPIEAGRDIDDGDTADRPLVVVVNAALATRYFGSAQESVGARLALWGGERRIAGVVGDVKDAPWDRAAQPALFFPAAQQAVGGDMILAVRTAGDTAAVAASLQEVLRRLDPALPLANVRTLDDVASAAFAGRRFAVSLCVAFGLSAVFLAIVGTYGMMAQAVVQRSREFGVRQALGARPADIRDLVLRGGLGIGAVGIGAGAILALLSTRVLSSLLYETEPSDPVTYVTVAVLLLIASLLASYLPARKGMQVDPGQMLRE